MLTSRKLALLILEILDCLTSEAMTKSILGECVRALGHSVAYDRLHNTLAIMQQHRVLVSYGVDMRHLRLCCWRPSPFYSTYGRRWLVHQFFYYS